MDTDGDVVSAWLFDPDGTLLEGPDGLVSHLVCGGVYDWSTGLLYQGGRYFDPMLGIWLALLPLAVVQGRKKKRRGGHPWVLLVCVGLCAVGSLAGCGSGGTIPSEVTKSVCADYWGRIGPGGQPDYGFDYDPEYMTDEGECTDCDQLVTELRAESYGLDTNNGQFSYMVEFGGSPAWIPASPPYYGAAAKIEIVRTRTDVTFLDIARNCIVVQLVKGYRALRRVGSTEWEYDDIFNNPNNYMVDGPENGTNPNWLSYDTNVDFEGSRVFIRDTPKHPVAPGETILWDEEFVTLIYDKSVVTTQA